MGGAENGEFVSAIRVRNVDFPDGRRSSMIFSKILWGVGALSLVRLRGIFRLCVWRRPRLSYRWFALGVVFGRCGNFFPRIFRKSRTDR